MKILFLHPDDELHNGRWVECRWDRIIDLGRSGCASYKKALLHFDCPITPIDSLSNEFKEIHDVGSLLRAGVGRLVDQFGLDWWELTAILFHSQLESLVLLRKLADSIGPQDEIYVSRSGFFATALAQFQAARVQTFGTSGARGNRSLGHYLRVSRKFPTRQLLEIFWDKTDPGYQWRGKFAGKAKRSTSPVVLLPTAYVNVSRTGVAYAKSVPETNFLLVSTRPSGWIANPPSNVSTAWLRSYASLDDPNRAVECEDLVARWAVLRRKLEEHPEFRALAAVETFDDFPDRFARGLEIRDAWRNVLDGQPVQAVLCADDSNPYTHIPLLLAKKRGLPTVACHHGALDGRYLFKRTHADVVLAKGKMEEDYLTRACGLPRDVVEVGAPTGGADSVMSRNPSDTSSKSIIFFSEPYESYGGRPRDFYVDILSALANLALQHNCELIIKLHPFESLAQRKQLARQVLNPSQNRVVRVVSGPMEPNLLDRAWFAVTVQSTVAVDCALRGVPCFLCKWLECSPYGYVDQFIQFGVGVGMDNPEEMSKIPSLVDRYQPHSRIRENCSIPIDPTRLQNLLSAITQRTSSVLRS